LEGGTSSVHTGRKPVNEPYGQVATLIIVKTRMVDFYTLVSLEGCFISSICAGTAFPAAVHLSLAKIPFSSPSQSFRPKPARFISSICAGNAFPTAVHPELGKNPIQQPKPVMPTEASRRLFFSFAPANESAGAVEESLFDLSSKPETLNPAQIFQLFRAESPGF
jgi:hypothetical protein